MRVRPFIAGLLILAAAGFAGCSDDDNNNPTTPALTAAITAPATTTTGAVVTLIATTNPTGAGQTYAWTANGGVFSAANNDTTKWTAPDDDGTYEIVVIVGDGTNSATTKKSIVASNYVAAVEPHYVGDATCNACHSGIHENWAATGHAGALGTLAAEGMDGNPVCLGCHTVGFTTSIANGGYDEQWVPRLANVQCESCHGPASAHAGDPEHIKPIRNIQGGLCASCHNGAHHPTGDEWAASGHATILEDPDLAEVAMEGGSSGCNKCHNGLRAMIYLNDPVPPYEGNFDFSVVPDSSMNISCPVCHDPHGNDNRANLRNAALDVAIPEGSHPEAGAGRLCIACHNGRRTPTNIIQQIYAPTGRLGPHHSVQGDMLAGAGAYDSINVAFNFATSQHVRIQDGCVSCHTHRHDTPAGVVYTGHNFTPKVEACQPCHGPIESFEDVTAKDDYDGDAQVEGVQGEVKGLMANLSNTIVEATPADSTADRAVLAAALPASQDGPYDSFISAVGAKANTTKHQRKAGYNLAFVAFDQSKGVHNATYAIQLLQQSILYLNPGKLDRAKILVE